MRLYLRGFPRLLGWPGWVGITGLLAVIGVVVAVLAILLTGGGSPLPTLTP